MGLRTSTHTENMCKSKYLFFTIACLLPLFGAACTRVPAQPEFSAPSGTISPSRLESHLAAFGQIGPRDPGSEAASIARRYVAEALSEADAELIRLSDGDREHLEARLAGRNSGEVILIVPFPTLGADAWVDDAGTVLGLELIRTLAGRELEYSLAVFFAEVQSAERSPTERIAADSVAGGALATRDAVAAAGESLIRGLGPGGKDRLSSARAVLVLEAQAYQFVRIARDLPSHPVFRALFWETATSLGQSAMFSRAGAWASPTGLQTALQEARLGRILAIVDETTVLTDLSNEGPAPPIADPAAAAKRLGPLLEVVSEGIGRLMARFERIDAFSE